MIRKRSRVPKPPSPFPKINAKTLRAGFRLHRLHDARFAGNQFNPCYGRPSRFAPLYDGSGTCVPTLYAATSFEASAFETVFHDIPAHATRKIIKRQDLMHLARSELEIARDVDLAQLFEPDLRLWGITRSQVIDTLASTYVETVRWAQAIHAADTAIVGMIWTSRQCDPEMAVILFEGRVSRTDLRVLRTEEVRKIPLLLGEIRAIGRRSGITITT